MKEGWTIGMTVMSILLIAFGITYGITASIQYQTNRDNKIILGEGIVSDMEIQNDGGWGSFTMYLVSIDGKEFEITEDQYYNIEIGDYLIIYKGGKVEIS